MLDAEVVEDEGGPEPREPRRKPLPDAFWQATYDLTKNVERVERLSADDRFAPNAEKVAATCRGDLLRAIDALQTGGRAQPQPK